mmetsp:Transcript_32109/g.90184  ORF Transcript_32109/g.90184 Transcript_32109/m.90184 type:complete len:302 (+) Transcript_32109:94-999(+)
MPPLRLDSRHRKHLLDFLLLLLREDLGARLQDLNREPLEEVLDFNVELVVRKTLLLVGLGQSTEHLAEVSVVRADEACVLLRQEFHQGFVHLFRLVLVVADWQLVDHELPSRHVLWACRVLVARQQEHRGDTVVHRDLARVVALLRHRAAEQRPEFPEGIGRSLCETRQRRGEAEGVGAGRPHVRVLIAKALQNRGDEHLPNRLRQLLEVQDEVAAKEESQDPVLLAAEPSLQSLRALGQDRGREILRGNLHEAAEGLLHALPALVLRLLIVLLVLVGLQLRRRRGLVLERRLLLRGLADE